MRLGPATTAGVHMPAITERQRRAVAWDIGLTTVLDSVQRTLIMEDHKPIIDILVERGPLEPEDITRALVGERPMLCQVMTVVSDCLDPMVKAGVLNWGPWPNRKYSLRK
jgi:hypothetical protein